jgi:chromosome transmission fidelity protein 18
MESITLTMSKDVDGKPHPNCLILDKIDGADAKGAIKALVNIIRAEIPMKGSKGQLKTYLRRPIIFICNNKFAPALQPLLPYARQFNVTPSSPNRLVARLRSILTAENISVFGGSSMLNQLVTLTCGDIRSCLYTLQFASSRARELAVAKKRAGGSIENGTLVDLSEALIGALNGDGMMDERNDVAGTVTAVFRRFKERKLNDKPYHIIRDNRTSVDRVLDAVQAFGDSSRILDCLFLKVLRVSFIDPTLERCAAAHEWLSLSDSYRSIKTSVAANNSAALHTMQKLLHPICSSCSSPSM